jgi:hypothetical protein
MWEAQLTLRRWPTSFGGLKIDLQQPRKDLELEYDRLRRLWVDLIRKQVEQINLTYPGLYDQIVKILYDLDPDALDFELDPEERGIMPLDEYAPEARIIIPRLKEANSEADVYRIVHEVFVRAFGEDAERLRIHGYDAAAAAAEEIWAAWIKYTRPLT